MPIILAVIVVLLILVAAAYDQPKEFIPDTS